MPDLVSVDELRTYLGDREAPYDVLEDLLTAIEDLLERECDRVEAPFNAALTGRVEVHDGTGGVKLWVHYPIATIATVTIGRNPAAPEETLAVADPDSIVWVAGQRRIVRVDGGTFARRGDPRCVRVTYDTQADLPPTAILAVKRVAAAAYRQRGAEDVTSQTVMGESRDLVALAEGDAAWRSARTMLRRMRVLS